MFQLKRCNINFTASQSGGQSIKIVDYYNKDTNDKHHFICFWEFYRLPFFFIIPQIIISYRNKKIQAFLISFVICTSAYNSSGVKLMAWTLYVLVVSSFPGVIMYSIVALKYMTISYSYPLFKEVYYQLVAKLIIV